MVPPESRAGAAEHGGAPGEGAGRRWRAERSRCDEASCALRRVKGLRGKAFISRLTTLVDRQLARQPWLVMPAGVAAFELEVRQRVSQLVRNLRHTHT